LVSGDPQARQEVASFVAEALKPQAADLSGDPGYLEGTGTDWLLPPPSNAVVPQERQTAQLTD
jgi:hypothetical protein